MEAPSSKEEDDVEVVQLVGVDLRHPPTMLQGGGRASMVGKVVELLYGLRLERG